MSSTSVHLPLLAHLLEERGVVSIASNLISSSTHYSTLWLPFCPYPQPLTEIAVNKSIRDLIAKSNTTVSHPVWAFLSIWSCCCHITFLGSWHRPLYSLLGATLSNIQILLIVIFSDFFTKIISAIVVVTCVPPSRDPPYQKQALSLSSQCMISYNLRISINP